MCKKKKSRHIPKKNSKTKNIIRCVLLSIDDRSSLTCDMCGDNFDEEVYKKILEVLVEQRIIAAVNKEKPICDTADFIITDYKKAEYYMKSHFYKCLQKIEQDLVPLINLVSATLNFAASLKG